MNQSKATVEHSTLEDLNSIYGTLIFAAWNNTVNLKEVSVSHSKTLYSGLVYLQSANTFTMDNSEIEDMISSYGGILSA